MSHWYQQDVASVLSHFETQADAGLSEDLIARRLEEFGPNELIETGGRGPWRILWEQISGPMVILLLVAAGVSVFLNEIHDAIVILAIVILNAVLGFFQDYRAEKAMAALKQMAVPHVRVRRGGHVEEISARDLVPGDVVLLEAGNIVPADGRLIECQNLKVQEAALTGESVPVEKTAKTLDEHELPLGDRRNLVFMGTTVTYGRGQVVVTETGMQTELGHIAGMLQAVESEQTPLQRRLALLGKQLTIATIGIVAVVFGLGLLGGKDIQTDVSHRDQPGGGGGAGRSSRGGDGDLAIGARRMLRRHALIRRLPAVETLGSVTVICSDKTGTLTENRMVVRELESAGEHIDLAEAVRSGRAKSLTQDRPALTLLLTVSSLCNDAILGEETSGDEEESKQTIGDPTETALVTAAAEAGLNKSELEKFLPRIAELPFDSDRKRMSTVHELTGPPSEEGNEYRQCYPGNRRGRRTRSHGDDQRRGGSTAWKSADRVWTKRRDSRARSREPRQDSRRQ